MNTAQHDANAVASEDRLRAGVYALLAELLRMPPTAALYARLLGIDTTTDGTDDMARAWRTLHTAAATANPVAVAREFHALFIGLGRGELMPYGSWYLTGFLMEKPLGQLRADLARLGYERQETAHEPEDHAAALCEIMALLILDRDVPFTEQRAFFESHLGAWLEAFFRDLEKAPSAHFYRAVSQLGRAFIQLEHRYLTMPV